MLALVSGFKTLVTDNFNDQWLSGLVRQISTVQTGPHHRTGPPIPVMFGFAAMAIKFSLCFGWRGENYSGSAYTSCHHLP